MQMYIDLTKLSNEELDNIRNVNMTPEEIFLHLNEQIKTRTFSETLDAFFDKSDRSDDLSMSQILINKLCEFSPNVKKDSIVRKVRDWLNDKYEPSSREDIIKICFALNFSEEKAQLFLSFTTDGGFHLRSPRELAFAYALRVGKSYIEAVNMLEVLKPLEKNKEGITTFILTKSIVNAFISVKDDESFFEFYKENYDFLGELHNTAYVNFLGFLGVLIEPEVPLYTENEKKYNIEDIVDEYLRMNVPLDKKTSKYTVLQKTIRRFWPNTTSIIRMRNRTDDVTRRVLLLLYLITEGERKEDAEKNRTDDYYDEELTDLECFEDHYWRLNSMLNDCGMSTLDPRNVFDWIILYSLKASDDEVMIERLQSILDKIF